MPILCLMNVMIFEIFTWQVCGGAVVVLCKWV